MRWWAGTAEWVSFFIRGEKIPFPYLKAIYWVRVQGKSVWVMEWRTECFCGLWISPPPCIRNSILEGNDGISAELLWRGQTGCAALFLYLGLLMDTECVNKRLVHFAHQNSGMWRARNQWLWTGQDALTVFLTCSLLLCLRFAFFYVLSQCLSRDLNIERQPES